MDSNEGKNAPDDNKTMLTSALPARHASHQQQLQQQQQQHQQQHQHQHVLHVSDTQYSGGKDTYSASSVIRRCRARIKIPLFINLIVTVGVGVVLAALEWGLIPQTKQGFYCRDPSISFPYRGDTVTMTTLLLVSTFGPLVVIALTEALREDSLGRIRARSVWDCYREYLVVYSMVLLFTEAAKVAFGEHRPHFLATCVPDTGQTCQSGTFVEEYRCTNKDVGDYFLVDSSRSFPSGHASISVVAGTYSAMVVHWRMPTRRTGRFLKLLLVCACCLWGLLCSLSRITDRRHHWWDVLAGSSLGVTGALYSSLFFRKCAPANGESVVVKPSRTSASTMTLLEERNKDAVSANI